MEGSPAACVGDNQWTSPMSPLMIWPYRPEQRLLHPEVIAQPHCSWLAVTTLKFKLTADYITMSRVLPERCDMHWGCVHFIPMKSVFHAFSVNFFAKCSFQMIHARFIERRMKAGGKQRRQIRRKRGREDKIISFLLFLYDRMHE